MMTELLFRSCQRICTVNKSVNNSHAVSSHGFAIHSERCAVARYESVVRTDSYAMSFSAHDVVAPLKIESASAMASWPTGTSIVFK